MRLKIINGRIIDPENNIDQTGDLFIDKGLIVGIDRAPKGFRTQKEIDATDQIV